MIERLRNVGKGVTLVVDDAIAGVSTCMASSEGTAEVDDCTAERPC